MNYKRLYLEVTVKQMGITPIWCLKREWFYSILFQKKRRIFSNDIQQNFIGDFKIGKLRNRISRGLIITNLTFKMVVAVGAETGLFP
jgi:hypothetical protein